MNKKIIGAVAFFLASSLLFAEKIPQYWDTIKTKLDSWKGQSQTAVYSGWGEPEMKHKSGSTETFTYSKTMSLSITQGSVPEWTDEYGTKHPAKRVDPKIGTYRGTVIITFTNDVVTSYQYSGDYAAVAAIIPEAK